MILKGFDSYTIPRREKPVVRYTDMRVCLECDTLTPVKHMHEPDTDSAYLKPDACPTCGTEFDDE